MLNAVNRVSGVYETEISVRLTLVANNNLLIFLDPATDPYTNNNGGAMLTQNINTCNSIIGSANYDIGHVFSTGGGGVAFLGVVCGANKAGGVTGLPNPVGDPFYIDYVAHEMGHQFAGNHTFNSVTGSCAGGNRNGSTAYEVGSGTSIQAYAGICGTDNIQPNSDPFFHTISFDEISNFLSASGGGCAQVTSNGNTLPVITAMNNNNANIPLNTPFTLTGAATDANGDPITYCWEEWDLGPGGAWNSGATSTTAPLFKSRVPKTTGERTFPDIAVILAGYPANPAATMGGLKGETLPQVARSMKFRLTVRDNRAGGGGVVTGGDGCQSGFTGIYQINTIAGTGPFVVTSPNGGESYAAGSTQTITWNVAGTDAAPINTSMVKISLSTDGGLTYPTVVLASTANDGSESVVIPSTPTTTARIKVEAIGNVFFDISNANFTITLPVNGYTFGTPTNGSAACPAAGPINSTLPVVFQGTYTGPVSVTYLSGAPGGTNVTISPNSFTANGNATVSLNNTSALAPGTYTVVIQGTGPLPGTTQTANVSFTVNPGSGPVISGQPGNATNCAGTNATFSVTAAGATGYQWQLSTTGCAGTFNNIAGATSASYTVTGVTAGQNGYGYRCIVSGQCGQTTSNCATLTVNTAPAITSNPSNIAVCSGSAASFTVAATGSSLTYQWQLSTGGGPFNNIVGATNPTYTIAATAVGMNGDQYRCVVSGACTPSQTSTAATLTVNSSVTVTGNPSNQTICEGTGTSFSASASGTGLNYQWQVSPDGVNWSNVANGANYSGATTPTLTLINTPPTFNQNRYRCNITSPPCTPGITTAALLTVNSYPVITGQPQSQTFCEGSNATLTVAATTSVGTLSYQWQVSINGGAFTNLVFPGSSLTPTNTNTLSQANVPATQNGYQYRCVVTAGCGSTNSSAATFTVNKYPVFSLNSLPKAVCVSDPAQTLTASITGGTWSGTGVTAAGVFNPAAAGIGNKTVTYTATNAGCTRAVSSQVQVYECADRHRKLNVKDAVIILPNPNRGNFSLRMNSDLYTNLGVQVYGADGKLYRTLNFSGLGFGSEMPVNLTSLAQGTYYLYMYNSENGFISRGDGVIIFH
jgi:hypothetical protein